MKRKGFTPMTAEQRKIADEERPTAYCARYKEGGCSGKLEVSHPFGRKIQRRWQWLFICARHHRGDLKNERIGKYHCYKKATEAEIKEAYPKTWKMMLTERDYLIREYGTGAKKD